MSGWRGRRGGGEGRGGMGVMAWLLCRSVSIDQDVMRRDGSKEIPGCQRVFIHDYGVKTVSFGRLVELGHRCFRKYQIFHDICPGHAQDQT